MKQDFVWLVQEVWQDNAWIIRYDAYVVYVFVDKKIGYPST